MRDKVFWVWRNVLFEVRIDELRRIKPDIAVEYRFGDISDINRLDMEHHEYDSDARQFALERLQQGDRVILGDYQGRVIFYHWLMFRTMELAYRRYMPISSNRAYIYKAFTVREYRGRQVLPSFYGFISNYLRQRGINKIVVTVNSRNVSALRGTTKGGFRPIGNIFRVRILPNIICFIRKELRMRLIDEGL